MKEINISEYENIDETKQHSLMNTIEIIEGKNNFPISLIKKQSFCEYQIYLQYVKHIKTSKAIKNSHGSEIQNQLEDIFKEDADSISFKKAIETSKNESLMSRKFFVESSNYGIRGFVDEIWLKDDEIVIINDAQGRTPYDSTMNFTRACCLAFSDMIDDERVIKAALRERGTENLFWIEVFKDEIKKDIEQIVSRIHDLLNGIEEFKHSDRLNKCSKCEFKEYCEFNLEK